MFDSPPLNKDRLAQIPVRMKEFVENGEVAGTVNLVAFHGKVALLEAVGWQDIEAKKPMRTDSIFQIMSMTKPITGTAIMMLMEEGKLRLLDPVEKWLPSFKDQTLKGGGKPAHPITIRDLMTHTSGMSGPYAPLADLYTKLDHTLAESVDLFAKAPLDFEPGSKWQYSNTGLATLGRLVEVVSGQPYEEFVAARILRPLGMKDSFYFPPADKTSRIAVVYRKVNGKLERSPGTILGGDSTKFRPGARYPAPEFGLFSTASDIFAFYQMMLNHGVYNGKRYLSQASIDLMSASHTVDLKAGHMPATAFGLTFELVRDPIGTLTLHSPGTFGHGGAFGTYSWVDRPKDLVGVFMVQSTSNATDVRDSFIQMAGSAIP